MTSKVWKITGKLTKEDDEKQKPMTRVVYLVQDTFPTTEEAGVALLNDWSSKPHAVELRAVIPYNVERDYGGFAETEQMKVIFNQPRPDAERILDYLAEAHSLIAGGGPPLPPDLEATVQRRIADRTWEGSSRMTGSPQPGPGDA